MVLITDIVCVFVWTCMYGKIRRNLLGTRLYRVSYFGICFNSNKLRIFYLFKKTSPNTHNTTQNPFFTSSVGVWELDVFRIFYLLRFSTLYAVFTLCLGFFLVLIQAHFPSFYMLVFVENLVLQNLLQSFLYEICVLCFERAWTFYVF